MGIKKPHLDRVYRLRVFESKKWRESPERKRELKLGKEPFGPGVVLGYISVVEARRSFRRNFRPYEKSSWLVIYNSQPSLSRMVRYHFYPRWVTCWKK